MSDVHVEVLPDPAALNGGRAVVRLIGIFYLPGDVTYRIEPTDNRIDANADPGWPGGDRRPNATRLTRDGIDLLIGPDVVEARRLAPGTLVRITIPAAAIDMELRWPDIPRQTNRSKTKLLPPPLPARKRPATGHADGTAHTSTPDQRTDDTATNWGDKPSPQDGARNLSAGAGPKGQSGTGPEPGKEPTQKAEPPQKAEPAPLTPAMPRYLERAMTQQPKRPATPGLVKPFLIGLVIAAAISAAGWIGFQNEIARYVRALAEARLAGTSAAPSSPRPALFELFAEPESTSPRGRSAQNVSRTDALAIADTHLRANPPDRAEARFWLRTAMSRALGDAKMTWALTQLGTLYAAGIEGAAPDYARARTFWEIAGAHGDPVALCFLGLLHEKGLGVRPAPTHAQALYAQAEKRGGCPQRARATSTVQRAD